MLRPLTAACEDLIHVQLRGGELYRVLEKKSKELWLCPDGKSRRIAAAFGAWGADRGRDRAQQGPEMLSSSQSGSRAMNPRVRTRGSVETLFVTRDSVCLQTRWKDRWSASPILDARTAEDELANA